MSRGQAGLSILRTVPVLGLKPKHIVSRSSQCGQWASTFVPDGLSGLGQT